MSLGTSDVTLLLRLGREGNKAALDQAVPLVYEQLRRFARQSLRNQPPGQTLQTTDLVHEAYLRLVTRSQPDWRDRAHFFAFATTIMRQILVDHARSKCASKRGGQHGRTEFKDSLRYSDERAGDLVAVDDALKQLAAFDQRKARVLELKFFGGLSTEEISEVLGTSTATVGRDIRFAEAWLRRNLGAS